jgi:hypothetical protein
LERVWLVVCCLDVRRNGLIRFAEVPQWLTLQVSQSWSLASSNSCD